MLRAAVRAQPAGWEGVGIERPRTAAEPSKRARIGTSRAAARWRIAAASDDNAEDDVGDERELEALDALLDAEEEDGSGSLEASLSMDQDANPLPQNEGAVEGVKSVDDADAEEDEEEEAYNTHGDEAEHTQRSDHDEGIDVPEVDESMRLSELLHAAGEALMETHRVGPPADRTEIVGLTHDSRVMIPGDVFVCIPGIVFDGHKFAEKAVECGATAIVAENEIRRVEKQGTVPIIYVQDARHALTVLADAFYRMPSHSLECVGITGTNGKTTTSYLVKAVLEEAGHEVGISSTIAQEVGDMKMTPQGERWEPAEEDIDPDRQITAPGALAPHYGRYTKPAVTTPDALNIQQLLNGMLSEGATAAVLETSSHALQQGRVHRVHFDTCVLTNITHDHLDYHGSFAAYKRAKMRLFEKLPLEDKLADREKANLRTVQYEERVPKSDGIHLLEELKEKLVDTDGGFERSDTIVSKRSSSIKPRTTNAASPEDSLRNESSRFSQIGDSAGKQDQLKEAGWTSDDSPMQPYRDTDNIDKRHRHDDQSITETTKDPGQPGESSEGWNELSVSSNAEDAIDQEFSEDALQVGSRYPPRRAVINADDTDAEDFINAAYPVESITYSRDPLRDDVDVVAEDVQCSLFETELDVRTPQGNVNILTPLIGEPNVQNILAAVATGIARDIPLETVKAGIESVVGVPGRLELIDLGQPYAVIVDYAHTPDALDSLLQTVQDVGAKRIITVFGCGGDRDPNKRPLMGKVAHERSDIVFVTSDNTRTEMPSAICDDIVRGFEDDLYSEPKLAALNFAFLRDMNRFNEFWHRDVLELQDYTRRYVVEDRYMAIRAAINMAAEQDAVVIAGKGHEDFIEVGNDFYWFDDRAEARHTLETQRQMYERQDGEPATDFSHLPWKQFPQSNRISLLDIVKNVGSASK